MKNLKKLNRNELKTIAGGGLLDDIIGTLDIIKPLLQPILNTVNEVLCRVECISNGAIEVKFLPCESTC